MTGSNIKTPKQGTAGSLLMIHLNSNFRNTFIVLETDTLVAVQQSPGLLKEKDRGVNTSVGKLERKKDSIAWKQSWEGNGITASRKPGLQI
jgi:hypothetical protein